MTRPALILVIGLLAAVTGYGTIYYLGTKQHRQILENPAPELAWLKKEFQLGDTEFERIAKLHDGYLPRCAELCRQIARENAELRQLISVTNVDARAVEAKLKAAGDLRVQCQQSMFNHFLEVSRQMPPAQGRRYLQWIEQRTLTAEQDMAQRHDKHSAMGHH